MLAFVEEKIFEMTTKGPKNHEFFLRDDDDDIKSKFKSHKSFLFLLTGDYLMIKNTQAARKKRRRRRAVRRIFSSQK